MKLLKKKFSISKFVRKFGKKATPAQLYATKGYHVFIGIGNHEPKVFGYYQYWSEAFKVMRKYQRKGYNAAMLRV